GLHPADASKGLSDVDRAGGIHGERAWQLDKGTNRRASVARLQNAGYGLSGVSRRLLSGNRTAPPSHRISAARPRPRIVPPVPYRLPTGWVRKSASVPRR